MGTQRLRVVLAVLLIAAFILLPSAFALLPSGSAAGPATAQAMPAWDVLTIERQTALSEIIVTGEVVRIDPPRWNSASGKHNSGAFSCAGGSDALPAGTTLYSTFYVKPAKVLKGAPQWGTPIAFRITGAIGATYTTDSEIATLPTAEDSSGWVTLLSVGDSVVVFGEVAADRYGGGTYDPAGAYWLTMDGSSLWSGPKGATLSNHGLLRYQDEKELSAEALAAKVQAYVKAGVDTPPVGGGWTNLAPTGPRPSARFGEALISLEKSGKILMFGGATDETHALSETWLYDPLANAWSEVAPAGEAPPARWGMAACYLPATDRVLVFGGMGSGGEVLDDTWLYDVAGNSWAKLQTASAPSARYQANVIYDAVTKMVVLFGGRYSRPGLQQDFNDTWELDTGAKTWTDLKPTGTGPTVSPGSAWLLPADGSSTATLFLLAGPPPISENGGPTPALPNDKLVKSWSIYSFDGRRNTWERWTTLPDSPPPMSRFYALAFAPPLSQAVLFGGLDIQDNTLAYTWIFDRYGNGGWNNVTNVDAPRPPGRVDAGMAFDPLTHRFILFGGRGGQDKGADLPADTWGFTPSS